MNYFYDTLQSEHCAEFKDRGSKFIAFAFPSPHKGAFTKRLKELKQSHPKATHYCYAYHIGLGPSTQQKASDDGEPAGTAGIPILKQIQQKKLLNVGIVVIRYFGGTLLGTAGLMNAYKNAASLALQVSYIETKPLTLRNSIECEYAAIDKVLSLIQKYACTLVSKQLGLFCIFVIDAPLKDIDSLRTELQHIAGLQLLQERS